MHYAKTQKSFEEIALKFVKLDDKSALLNYLKKKLEAVRGGDRAQMTMIVVWIVDTYLSDLNREPFTNDVRKMCRRDPPPLSLFKALPFHSRNLSVLKCTFDMPPLRTERHI